MRLADQISALIEEWQLIAPGDHWAIRARFINAGSTRTADRWDDGSATPLGCTRQSTGYSPVTDLARFRSWSTSVPNAAFSAAGGQGLDDHQANLGWPVW